MENHWIWIGHWILEFTIMECDSSPFHIYLEVKSKIPGKVNAGSIEISNNWRGNTFLEVWKARSLENLQPIQSKQLLLFFHLYQLHERKLGLALFTVHTGDRENLCSLSSTSLLEFSFFLLESPFTPYQIKNPSADPFHCSGFETLTLWWYKMACSSVQDPIMSQHNEAPLHCSPLFGVPLDLCL